MKKVILVFGISAFLFGCGGEESRNDETTVNENREETRDNTANESTQNESGEAKKVDLTVKTVGETMTEMQYDPTRLEVPAGSEVTLTLVNEASSEAMIHNFVLVEFGKEAGIYEEALKAGTEKNYVPDNSSIIASSKLAHPGETVSFTFKAPDKKGTYRYICTYPGHTAMKGILLVK